MTTTSLIPLPDQFSADLENRTDFEFTFFKTSSSMLRCCVPGCLKQAAFSMTETSGKFRGLSPVKRVFDHATLPSWPVCEHHGVMIAEVCEDKGVPWGFGMEGNVRIEAFRELRRLKE